MKGTKTELLPEARGAERGREQSERTRVLWLFLFLFGLTAASTVGRTAADTLFLSRFDASYLTYMYLPQAAAMVSAGIAFQRMSRQMRMDRLLARLLPLLAALVAASGWGVRLGIDEVFMAIYIGYDIVNFMLLACFWQFATAVMDQRQAKRTIGWVGSGGLAGGIVSGFAVTWLAPLTGTENLIFGYAALLLGCALPVAAIVRGLASPIEAFRVQPSAAPARRTPAGGMPGEGGLHANVPHLKYMAVLSASLVLALTLFDYQFKVILKENLQDEALAGFMGSFHGYAGLLALVFQWFVAGRALTRFGVMTSIVLLPAVLLAGCLGLLAMPVLAMAVFVRGSDRVIGDTIYTSVTQFIMFPIPLPWRSRAKGFLDGVVRNGAKGLSAVCLLLLPHMLSFRQLTCVVIGWLLVGLVAAIKVKKAYLQTLLATMETGESDARRLDLDELDPAGRRVLTDALAHPDARQALYALRILQASGAFDFAAHAAALLGHPAPEVRAEALGLVEAAKPDGLAAAVRGLLDDGQPQVKAAALLALAAYAQEPDRARVADFLHDGELSVRAAAVAALMQYYGRAGQELAEATLTAMLESPVAAERAELAAMLGRIGDAKYAALLGALLEDASPVVRRSALRSAAPLRAADLLPRLVPLLASGETRREALEALGAFDARELAPLLRPGHPVTAASRRAVWQLPKALERIGTQEAFDALLLHYEASPFAQRDRLLASLLALRRQGLQAERELVERLVAGELRASETFGERLLPLTGLEPYAELIEGTAQLRIGMSRRCFELLSLAHEERTIRAIYLGWSEGDARRQANAAEAMEQLLQGPLRASMAQLMAARPGEAAFQPQPEEKETRGQLTNTLKWLARQEDEWVSALARYFLQSGVKPLDAPSPPGSSSAESADLVARVRLLRQVGLFQGLPGRELFAVAQQLDYAPFEPGAIVLRQGDPGDSLYIVAEGRAAVVKDGATVGVLAAGDGFGEMALLTGDARTATIRAETELALWRLDSAAFYELMFDRSAMAFAMMRLLSLRLRERLAAGAKESPRPVAPSPETTATRSDATALTDDLLVRRVLVLQKVGLFAPFAADDLVRLAQLAGEAAYEPGAAICREGEPGDSMFAILEGAVRIHRGEEAIAMLGEGECFGEMALIDGGLRSADCTADDRTVVLELHRDQAFSFCFQNIEVLRGLIGVLADRLKRMS